MDVDTFFRELAEFSKHWIQRYLPGLELESPWCSAEWSRERPSGAVIHYTADIDVNRVMRWFLDRRYKARVSAHAVILPGWTQELRELASGLSAVEALSAPILQVVPIDKEAWHATWANDWAYGIENLNIGELRCSGGEFFSWRPREPWTAPWKVDDGEPVPLFGRWWCTYPRAQLRANVELLKMVHWYYDDCLERGRILGHECVQSNKRDPGPAFPVHGVRRAFLDNNYRELDEASTDILYGERWRDSLVMSFYEQSVKKAWDALVAQVFDMSNQRPWDQWTLSFLLLELLGYTPTRAGNIPLRIFQRMSGVQSDGIIGPVTWGALIARVKDRGILPTETTQ